MCEESLEFLRALINTPSPSGFEQKTAGVWRKYTKEYAHGVNGDPLGNSIAVLAGTQKRQTSEPDALVKFASNGPDIMLCAHLDEVGLMIHHVDEDGFLYVSQIGGLDPAVLPGQRISVQNRRGPVPGVVSRPATHLMKDEDQDETTKIHNLIVDIGAVDKDDALQLVDIGDPIVLDLRYAEMGGGLIVGRGLDDRVGAWCVAEALRVLANSKMFSARLFAVASTGEENGAYGATAVTDRIKPQAALAIDLTHATDTPEVSKEKHGDIKLGEGPVMAIGSITNPIVNDLLVKAAEDNRIPLQREAAPRWTGTDGDAINMGGGGVATGLVSIPARYMHTPVEVVSKDDLENTVKLLVAWCELVSPGMSFDV